MNIKKHNSSKKNKLCFIIEFAMCYQPIYYILNKKRINNINLNKGFISNDMVDIFSNYIGKIDYLILYFHDYFFNSDNLIVLPMYSKRSFKEVIKKNYIFYNGTDKYNEFRSIIRYNFTLDNINKINKNQYVFNTRMDRNGESLKKCLEAIQKTIFNNNKSSNNIVIDIYTYSFIICLAINIINYSIKSYNVMIGKYPNLLK